MTLAELSSLSLGRYGARYRINQTTLRLLINELQNIIYAQDHDSYKIYEDFTVHSEIVFQAGGYTPATDIDVGKIVTNGVNSAVLVGYNNTTRTWLVNSTASLLGAVTITLGTGAGTVISQNVYSGTYDIPSTIRKLEGVTTYSESNVMTPTYEDDYGVVYDVGKPYIAASIDHIGRKIRILTTLDDNTQYYWVGYKASPEITSLTDEDNFTIPQGCRWEFFTALGVMSRDIFDGNITDYTQFQALIRRVNENMFTKNDTTNIKDEWRVS